AEPDLRIVGDLRHRAHRGARGLYRVGLLDRDRRADVLDLVDLRLVEQVEELARVGAEGLDVAALSLRVNRIEHERTRPGAAETGDHDVPAERQIEVEAFQVVLADAAKTDRFGR